MASEKRLALERLIAQGKRGIEAARLAGFGGSDESCASIASRAKARVDKRMAEPDLDALMHDLAERIKQDADLDVKVLSIAFAFDLLAQADQSTAATPLRRSVMGMLCSAEKMRGLEEGSVDDVELYIPPEGDESNEYAN
jgi:hypothetical protein